MEVEDKRIIHSVWRNGKQNEETHVWDYHDITLYHDIQPCQQPHTWRKHTEHFERQPVPILIHSFHRKARKSLADLHPEGSNTCRHLRDIAVCKKWTSLYTLKFNMEPKNDGFP